MNLTKTAELVKNILRAIGLLIVVYIVVRVIIIPTGINLYRSINPPKDLPNVAYGKLDPIQFTEKTVLTDKPTYVLNTTTGRLPNNLPNKFRIYIYKPWIYSYSAGKEAFEQAQYLGFSEKNLSSDLKGEIYKWRNGDMDSTLEININTKELKVDTNLSNKAYYYFPGSIRTYTAVDSAKAMLSRIGRFSDTHYSQGTQTVYLGKFEGNKIVNAATSSEAQIAKVNFFRSVGEVPVVGPDKYEGLIYTYVGSTYREKEGASILKYPKIRYKGRELNTTVDATYPLVPISQAWREVQKGNGVISGILPRDQSHFETYQPVKVDTILINEIYLAYFEDINPCRYLQPIYVFEGAYTAKDGGKGDIAIYYPAITGEYIQQGISQ